ncbi:MAG: ergothioneine biosynthesis protein EgtB [Proteobacteria bacterium]|nr:ergothioneine biosynthesis protein EgtB [Pseudomonadota bacterium]
MRGVTEWLCRDLDPEDGVAQSMPDASPTKWHLAHTTWFFETFLLETFDRAFAPFHPDFRFLFNSYYNAVGARHARPERGLLTRPTWPEVLAYRAHVDERVATVMARLDGDERERARSILELGLHHEQQHQELVLTDLKHLFAQNVLGPAYRSPLAAGPAKAESLRWIGMPEGLRRIGHAGPGFAFDNESPSHRRFLGAFALSDRLVTNGEYLDFVEAGGYRTASLWFDVGWQRVCEDGWELPLYWRRTPGGLEEFTLAGWRELALGEPVSHVSYFEAQAFATFAGARLPTEAEWEVAARTVPVAGNFIDSGRAHPQAAGPEQELRQLFGDVWEWTQSDYAPYPGYRSAEGALGEYNGKFMCDQRVLRGGSCASSSSHLRATYRNFFYPADRWQFSGIRLAKDLS